MYINQQDAQISVIKLYLFIRCSTCPSYSHTTATRMVSAYTKCDVQLIKLLLKMD